MRNDKPVEISSGSQPAFTDRAISKLHKFYLVGEVKGPSEYVQWFETIRNASENDIVVIHINSPGGDLLTAVQFMRVMAETKAHIVASVEGMCMSAATLIFLSARSWEISNHSMFMFHNYTSGLFGKGGEMHDQIQYERKWSEKLWNDIYSDFLSAEEIKDILANKDIWLFGEEVTKRLEARAKKLEAKAKKKPTKK